jgi:hypothetical protein
MRLDERLLTHARKIRRATEGEILGNEEREKDASITENGS